MPRLKDTIPVVRFYEEVDPYYFAVDNRPIADLKARDDIISDRVDQVLLGRVDVTGGTTTTTNFLPSGWSVTRVGAGNYTITHSLNIDSLQYSVGGCVCYNTVPSILTVTAMTANSLTIITNVVSTGVATDMRFSFTLSAG